MLQHGRLWQYYAKWKKPNTRAWVHNSILHRTHLHSAVSYHLHGPLPSPSAHYLPHELSQWPSDGFCASTLLSCLFSTQLTPKSESLIIPLGFSGGSPFHSGKSQSPWMAHLSALLLYDSPITCDAPFTLASLLFLNHARPSSTLGPLFQSFPLPRMLFLCFQLLQAFAQIPSSQWWLTFLFNTETCFPDPRTCSFTYPALLFLCSLIPPLNILDN